MQGDREIPGDTADGWHARCRGKSVRGNVMELVRVYLGPSSDVKPRSSFHGLSGFFKQWMQGPAARIETLLIAKDCKEKDAWVAMFRRQVRIFYCAVHARRTIDQAVKILHPYLQKDAVNKFITCMYSPSRSKSGVCKRYLLQRYPPLRKYLWGNWFKCSSM